MPYVLYRDPAAAAQWIIDVLGFREAIRFTVPEGGPAGHVELGRNGAVLMLGLAGSRFGETSAITLVFVDDVIAACQRARDHGGRVVNEPTDQLWGLRHAVVADPEGQRWELTQHLHDVDPADWGAVQHGPLPG
ncbi:MAG: VOC family protein [Trebonia sp.]